MILKCELIWSDMWTSLSNLCFSQISSPESNFDKFLDTDLIILPDMSHSLWAKSGDLSFVDTQQPQGLTGCDANITFNNTNCVKKLQNVCDGEITMICQLLRSNNSRSLHVSQLVSPDWKTPQFSIQKVAKLPAMLINKPTSAHLKQRNTTDTEIQSAEIQKHKNTEIQKWRPFLDPTYMSDVSPSL